MADNNRTLIDMLMGTWPARAAQSAYDAVRFPGQVYQSPVPVTTEQMVQPAADLAGLVTLGAGAIPAEANSLRAGVRTYQNVPDPLMGYGKNGPQKGFAETNYPHVLDVEITNPATQFAPRDTFRDQIKGMNADHAYERAWRNWPNAEHITPLSQEMIKALLSGRGT